MENGYKNWPIVRKLLIDNRLEHAALLAYSIGVPEMTFVMRARSAYRKVETRVQDAVEIANETLSTVANAVQAEEERAAQQASGWKTGPDEPPDPAPTKGEEPPGGVPGTHDIREGDE